MVNPFALIEAFFQIFNGMVFATLLIVTLLKDRLFAPLAINAEPLLLETPPLYGCVVPLRTPIRVVRIKIKLWKYAENIRKAEHRQFI